MDRAQLEHYRQVIETILSEYAALPYSYAPIQSEVVFDRHCGRFRTGWHSKRPNCVGISPATIAAVHGLRGGLKDTHL